MTLFLNDLQLPFITKGAAKIRFFQVCNAFSSKKIAAKVEKNHDMSVKRLVLFFIKRLYLFVIQYIT